MTRLWLVFAVLLLALSVHAAENDVVLSSYNYEPSPVEAGQTFELWAHVTNNSGNNINNVEALPKFEYPFSLPEGDVPERFLGTLTPQGSALINYEYIKVDPNTPSGEYQFEFKVGPRNGIGRNYFVKVKVTQKKPDIELIAVAFEPQVLKPGLEDSRARLRIKNLGKTPAFDIKVIMDVPTETSDAGSSTKANYHIKPVGSPLSYLDKILPGEEKEMELRFSVDRDAELKTYLIPLKIDYKNENNVDFSFEREIGAEITDNAELDVVLVAVDPLAVVGNASKVSMDVFNAGGATANYVIAEPSSEAAEKIIPEKVFVGTLEPDDFDSFTFQMQLKRGLEAGVYPVQVRLSYRDKGVLRELPAKPISISVYTPAEASAMAKQDLPILPAAVVLVLAAYFFRERLLKLAGFGKKE